MSGATKHAPETVFDRVAELYDEARPSYPERLVDDVVALSELAPGARVLEIGAGTGKATRLFAKRGFAMLCIEPGDAMRELAAARSAAHSAVQFRGGSFEDWRLEPGAFDLVIAAQSFHWLDPALRYQKTADALRAGGSIALFWNRPVDVESELRLALDAVYAEHAPHMARQTVEIRNAGEVSRIGEELVQSGRFEALTEREFPWSERYDTARYVALMGTHSDHLHLPEAQRAALHGGLARVIDEAGGKIEIPSRALLYHARRR